MENRAAFEERLLAEAVNVRDKIEEINAIGNINLLHNAHKLVLYIVENREHEMITFAKVEGEAWAKYSLTLAFKLEWIQSVRRAMWNFLYNYDRLRGNESNREEFFALEKQINEMVDHFLSCFFLSYSQFKDRLIQVQRNLVEDLSVPIIPVTEAVSILPLIGVIDSYRASTIEEKVIQAVGNTRIESLILDLSGTANMDPEVIQHMLKVIEGISMMGCKTIVTGIRPEIVRQMIRSGLTFEHRAETKGTLQQALADCLTIQV
ncbi:STAS domain-containing protein [Brevibacillus humidisoli]|uniref:STAS domain-containing protein n=1 Tax=Brevibacillus humidisoli TaxID=2895522 RepID=UPI001E6098DD|nr:STAS domain-containing protein [Brevibacillus humidisoli]UFJ41136.1 STAS domain-containing protein [Brevibacillus humidisoli]